MLIFPSHEKKSRKEEKQKLYSQTTRDEENAFTEERGGRSELERKDFRLMYY